MRLYSYWRSSCSWRVRIGLSWKGLDYETVPVHLVRDGGEQNAADYADRNPLRQVPLLEWTDGIGTHRLAQSLAILEYLEEAHPQPPLLPPGLHERGLVRMLAEAINAGIQPLQNLQVIQAPELPEGREFAHRMIQRGLDALERMAAHHAGDFLVGDAVSLADVCLVPQLYNARRFGCDESGWTTLLRVEQRCTQIPAFQAAHPDRQPDAQPA